MQTSKASLSVPEAQPTLAQELLDLESDVFEVEDYTNETSLFASCSSTSTSSCSTCS